MKQRTQTTAERPSDDAWLDEALEESFPASDPIPWRHADVRPQEKDVDTTPAQPEIHRDSVRAR